MRVLLVYPNAQREIIGYMDRGAIAEPISLEYVAAAAKEGGHEVKLLDLRLHKDKLDEVLLAYRPELVGLTGYSMHALRNLELAARVKELVPECKTAIGGLHATWEAQDFFEPQIDLVFPGEGISAFRRVLAALAKGEPALGIPGVHVKDGDRHVWGGEPARFEIDSLPRPDRTLVPEDRPHYFIDYMKPIALMRTSVGCPYRCTFCSLWRIMDGRFLKRDLDDVVAELAEIPERHIHLADDEPFVDAKRMDELAAKIEASGIQKEFYAYCRIDTFLRNRPLMERWVRIGLKRLFFGVETVFETELMSYNKRQEKDQIIQGHRLAKELGIGIFSGFIIGTDYTEKEFDEVKRFIREYEISYPSFTIWTPIPGIDEGGTDYTRVTRRQANGRPNWMEFDLQHAVVPTKLPIGEFMRQYWSLYQTSFWGNEDERKKEEAKQAWMKLMQAALSAARRPPGPAKES